LIDWPNSFVIKLARSNRHGATTIQRASLYESVIDLESLFTAVLLNLMSVTFVSSHSELVGSSLIDYIVNLLKSNSAVISQWITRDPITADFALRPGPSGLSSPFRHQCHPIYSKVDSRFNSSINALGCLQMTATILASGQCAVHHPDDLDSPSLRRAGDITGIF
jgi:hypothetical protein